MRRSGRDGEILRAAVQRAVERRDIDVSALDARLQGLSDAPDFALTRQKDEDRAAFVVERVERDPRDLILDARAWIAPDIPRRHGEGAALALYQRRVAEQRAHPRAVERRRHDKKPQILAQTLLRVEREGEPEVGVERALVELVEQNGRHAVERGIVEDHAGEHALGHDLDACALRDEARQPHAQADRLANLLPERRGHARGGCARGDAARLEQDEALALPPGLVEQREGRARGLASARRRDEHGARMLGERRREAHRARRRWEEARRKTSIARPW